MAMGRDDAHLARPPYPLGATWDGTGVNFALFSENATGVELCLFDERERRDGVGEDPLTRAHGPGVALLPARCAARASTTAIACTVRTTRATGTASIPAKLLIDPYAKAITGAIKWSNDLFAYKVGQPRRRTSSRSGQLRGRRAQVAW